MTNPTTQLEQIHNDLENRRDFIIEEAQNSIIRRANRIESVMASVQAYIRLIEKRPEFAEEIGSVIEDIRERY